MKRGGVHSSRARSADSGPFSSAVGLESDSNLVAPVYIDERVFISLEKGAPSSRPDGN